MRRGRAASGVDPCVGRGHWFGPADAEAVGILHLFGPHGDQGVVRTGPTAND